MAMSIFPADGRITSLATFNYEGSTSNSCTLTLTATDGMETSDPATLTIHILDVDETPVMSKDHFNIFTPEVTVSYSIIVTIDYKCRLMYVMKTLCYTINEHMLWSCS